MMNETTKNGLFFFLLIEKTENSAGGGGEAKYRYLTFFHIYFKAKDYTICRY
jgi:hypothetical protein